MVEELSPAAVSERVEDGGDVQVVDIRPPEQFAEGHVPGAENVPFGRLLEEVDDREWATEVVVVCPVGEGSRRAARLIASHESVPEDALVASMAGGYERWEGDLEVGP